MTSGRISVFMFCPNEVKRIGMGRGKSIQKTRKEIRRIKMYEMYFMMH